VDGRVIELVEEADELVLRLEGTYVSQTIIDYRFGLLVLDEQQDALRIAISNPFRFKRHEDKDWTSVDPEAHDDRLGELVVALWRPPLLPLVSCRIERASGRLKLGLDTLDIDVPAGDRYEAWDVDHARFKLVAMPGGEVAIWDR
jgi:hypothetical protein